MRRYALAFSALLAATAALAHQGVQDPEVQDRMEGMKAIGDATKVMGEMVRGNTPFDAAAVRAAAAEIEREALRIPALFESAAEDPLSEALPAIWENWDDFAAKAEGTAAAARQAAGVSDVEALRAALSGLADSCKACHEPYRE